MDVSELLVKVGLFVVVQALVYLILSNSSTIFSSERMMKSLSFRTVRSVSLRRLLASISDIPAGGEVSPSSAMLRSSSRKDSDSCLKQEYS